MGGRLFVFAKAKVIFCCPYLKTVLGGIAPLTTPPPIRLCPDLFASTVTRTDSVTFEVAQPRALSPLSLISIAFTCKFRSLSADRRKPKRLVGRASEGFG